MNAAKIHVALFERFIIEMSEQAVMDCSAIEQVSNTVAHWADRIDRPEECTPAALVAELRDYGAWEDAELVSDTENNWRRIVWLAARQIKDNLN
jgi:hypothetical protein